MGWDDLRVKATRSQRDVYVHALERANRQKLFRTYFKFGLEWTKGTLIVM